MVRELRLELSPVYRLNVYQAQWAPVLRVVLVNEKIMGVAPFEFNLSLGPRCCSFNDPGIGVATVTECLEGQVPHILELPMWLMKNCLHVPTEALALHSLGVAPTLAQELTIGALLGCDCCRCRVDHALGYLVRDFAVEPSIFRDGME
jgi:hypothetical protein